MKSFIPKHIKGSTLCNISYLLCLIFITLLTIVVVSFATTKEDYQKIVIAASGIIIMLILAVISKALKEHYEVIEFLEFIENCKKEDHKL